MAGVSRHDLVPGAVITLAADPVVVGATYAWEILDKVGSTAALVGSGSSVTLTLGAGDQPCAFLIKLTETNGTTATSDIRIASVRTLGAGLRIPLFREAAASSNSLASHTGDSTDNATYSDLAGLGTPAQNWRGWAEWAREVVMAVEGAGGAASFVLRPGGTAAKNVYTTWAALYAVAVLVEGPVLVQFDTSLGTISIPAGTYEVHGWSFVGYLDEVAAARPDVTLLDGVVFNGGFRAEKIIFRADAGLTDTVFHGIRPQYDFWDCELYGTATIALIHTTGDFPSVIFARGTSYLGECSVYGQGSGCIIYLCDKSGADSTALVGDGRTITIYFLNNESWFELAQTNWTGVGGAIYVSGAHEAFNGPIDAVQTGVTELHIGSVYVQGPIIGGADFSEAMLGVTGTSGAMHGYLKLKKSSDATLIATWEAAGALGVVNLADHVVCQAGWHDLYICTSDALDTVTIKGVRLLTIGK